MEETLKVKKGIWTPWAQVLCYECFGKKFAKSAEGIGLTKEELAKNSEAYELTSDRIPTPCDYCAHFIVFDYDSVAYEHNMVNNLKAAGLDARMEQTGGMCSAACLKMEDGSYHYMIYDDNKTFSIAKFDADDEWIEGPENNPVFDIFELAYDYLTELEGAKKLKRFRYQQQMADEAKIIDEYDVLQIAEYYMNNADLIHEHILTLDVALDIVASVNYIEEVEND